MESVAQRRKNILKLAIPILIETILASLFGIVDLLMVSRAGVGQKIIASIVIIGITNQYIVVGQMVVQALSSGATSVIARYLGANRLKDIPEVVKHSIIINMVFIIIPFVLISFIFSENILRFFGASAYDVEIGNMYYRIIIAGMLFQAFNITITGVYRGIGNSKTPMKIDLFSNIFNILGNFVLIYGLFGFPALGVTGAAISTVFSQFIGTIIYSYFILFKKSKIQINLKEKFEWSRDILYNLIKIGIPASIEQFVHRVSLLIYIKQVASLGGVLFATHQVCSSIMSFTYTPGQSFGLAAQTLAGRSLGEDNPKKAERYIKECSYIAMGISFVIAISFLFFNRQITSMVTKDKDIINQAVPILTMLAFMQPFQAMQLTKTGGLRGAGDTLFTMISIGFCVLVIRLSLTHIFLDVLSLSVIGAWYAFLIDQICRFIVTEYRFLSGKWKEIKLR